MSKQKWDAFVTFVNAYYAVQEAYDSARRMGEAPAKGLERFCRDANPFLWDEHTSAEPDLYEGFIDSFKNRFGSSECTADEGRAFAIAWLKTLEGQRYGTHLVSSLGKISSEEEWREAYEPIARQLAARAVRIERTPQDQPLSPDQQPDRLSQPSPTDIEAVIALLSRGDKEFEATLRARLASESGE